MPLLISLHSNGNVLSYYKRNAKVRNMNWNLTNIQFHELIFSNCYYCDVKPSEHIIGGKIFIHNGIDRVDNSKRLFSRECCALL